MSSVKSDLGLTLNIERKVKVIISVVKPYTRLCVHKRKCGGETKISHILLAKEKATLSAFYLGRTVRGNMLTR